MSEPRPSWQLGIDFGTSFTVAAVHAGGTVSVLDVESNGQSRMPSSVFLTEDGQILVGTAAQHQSVFAPERFEATPKRSLTDGEIFLGDRLVPVTELVAAVLRRVYTEACRQRGETLPDLVRLTHPAEWASTRLALLAEAATRAGLPEVTFMAEPVAAAQWIAGAATSPGDRIAVYDFGGGTFDAAVLRRDERGFQVAGPPAGRDPLGGEDIDRHIVDYVGRVVGEDAPEEWESLRNPPDIAWRRRAAALRLEVRRAKETLSEVNTCQLWIPGLERAMQLTRAELDTLIGADVELSTDILLTALADAGLEAGELTGLYLVGGSSRIPLVAETLWRRLGIRPQVQDSPKSVVAMGAARPLMTVAPVVPSPADAPDERTVVTVRDEVAPPRLESVEGGRVFVPPSLVLTPPPELGGQDRTIGVELALRRDADGMVIRVREEAAADPGPFELAARIGAFRATRSPGYAEQSVRPAGVFGLAGAERHFTLQQRGQLVPWVERYLVAQGRALILAFPVAVGDVADAISFAPPAGLPGVIASPFVLPRPPGWRTSEQLLARLPDGSPLISAEREDRPAEPPEAWRWHRLEQLVRTLPAAAVVSRGGGRVVGGLPGDIVTIQWNQGARPMITKLGTATAGEHGLLVSISLPLDRQAEFRTMVGLVAWHPLVAPAR